MAARAMRDLGMLLKKVIMVSGNYSQSYAPYCRQQRSTRLPSTLRLQREQQISSDLAAHNHQPPTPPTTDGF